MFKINVGHLFSTLNKHAIGGFNSFKNINGFFDISRLNHNIRVGHKNIDLVIAASPFSNSLIDYVFGFFLPVYPYIGLGKSKVCLTSHFLAENEHTLFFYWKFRSNFDSLHYHQTLKSFHTFCPSTPLTFYISFQQHKHGVISNLEILADCLI